MPLSSKEYEGLKAALASGEEMDPAYQTWANEQIQQWENQGLDAWAKAGPDPVRNPVPVPGELGLRGIIGQDQPAQPQDEERKIAEVAVGLDPRFDLVPQALALQPGTTHPRGDVGAAEDWKAGTTGEVSFAYEPPVAIVRKQLLENPGLMRAIRPNTPPTPEEVTEMDADSDLYKDVSGYFWNQTARKALETGRTVVRYSKAPWAQDGSIMPSLEGLKLNIEGAGYPLKSAAGAFVLGLDDTAAFGAGRAALETASPEAQMSVPGGGDVMGLDENAPQKTEDLIQWELEGNRGSYALGQVAGAWAPWNVANRTLDMIRAGGGELAALVARHKAGQIAAKAVAAMPSVVKGTARVGAETATGVADAAITQAGQEAVDIGADVVQGEGVDPGRFAEASERVRNVGNAAVGWAAGGAVGSRLAHGGANLIRNSASGAVGRAEPNMSWGPSTVITGPRLNKDTKEIVKRANREGNQPGDYIAEQIAPPIAAKAKEHTARAEARLPAETRNFSRSPEGEALMPVTNLQQASLERLRDHHQPRDGEVRPVDDKYRAAQKVFSRSIEDVSLEPIEGAIKLTPEEASSFLGTRWRYKLLKDDIESSVAASQGKAGPRDPIDRDSFLRTIKDSRARAATEEEIEASIEDLLGDNVRSPSAYEKAEQKVLAEMADEAQFAEVNGSVGDYVRQRGKDAVYVKPQAYDARRTETLIKGLGDPDLKAAAELDRAARPMGGKPGGWSARRAKLEDDIAKAKKTEESIAPKADAFKATAEHGKIQRGDKQEADILRKLADEAGVRGELDRIRGMQDTLAIRNRSTLRGPDGRLHAFSPNSWLEAAPLHIMPILKALEPGGPINGRLGRITQIGQAEDDADRWRQDQSSRGKYERDRAARMKEIDASKAAEKSKREKRRAIRNRTQAKD